MRAVVQRVSDATVSVVEGNGGEQEVGRLARGLLIYLGVAKDDTEKDAQYLAEKISNLRIFLDDSGKMNLSIVDLGLSAMVVSQFTLFADTRRGRRPSFDQAAENELAERLYDSFCASVRSLGVAVATGRFRSTMRVRYANEGPITILLDSRKLF